MVKKQVTMKDVAKAMDVSIVTVSKALAGKDGVSDVLRERIVDKAGELGYIAKGDRSRREDLNINIGIVISERFVSDNSFYFKIYQQMLMELSKKGYIGILEIVRREDEETGMLPNIVRMNSVDQVVIVGEMQSIFLESLVQTGLGITFFDFENEEFDVDCVVSDGVNGGFLLTRYLVKNGHKRIGFVGNYKSTRSILDRYMGYMKYLIAKEQIYDAKWTLPDRDEDGKFIELELPDDMPDAFVCNCDPVAYRMIDALEKAGYSVPEDISVVGYDDFVEQPSEEIALTTYQVNTDEMIGRCIHIIEERAKNKNYRRGTTVVYGKLVVRDTVRRIE
ncbi:MAG: LacI family DNA-binding transcriptional regulator [Lachnospiraceae bacterium]|nr:LacI family DNA-binding transcriptional regulator [Lachnospiraceae bacterium]